jgi:hypothetical protein
MTSVGLVSMKPYDPVARVAFLTTTASSHSRISALAFMMQQCGALFWTTKVQGAP